MKLLLSLALTCFAFAAAAQQTTTLSKPAYSIKYPSAWTVDASTDAKQFTIKAPADSGVVDTYVENLNMVINQLTSPYTAEEYAKFSKNYLPQKIKQFVVLENKKGNFAGKDSWFMVFKGLQLGKKLQWKQYYIVQNGKVHILTFTAEEFRYKEYIKTVNTMLATYVAK